MSDKQPALSTPARAAMPLGAGEIEELRQNLLAANPPYTQWHVDALCHMARKALTVARSETKGWIPVTEALPEDQPGGWLVFDTNAGKLWFETNLPSWWNRKDERGREFDGPTVTHWREDFYPLPGPRK